MKRARRDSRLAGRQASACKIVLFAGLVLQLSLLGAQQQNPAADFAVKGWKAFEEGRTDEAKQSLNEAVRLAPTIADYQAALAEVDAKSGDAKAAVEHFKKAVQLKPADAEFRLSLAEILQTQNNDEEALRILQTARPDTGLSDAWHFSRGFSLFRIGRFVPAREEFETVLENPRFKASASFFLGNIAYSEGAYNKAEPLLAAAVSLGAVEGNKAYNAYTYDYGLVLFKLAKFAEAKAQFEASIARFEGDPLPWMFLGRCEEELGDYPSAIEMLETSIKKDPAFQLSYYELARLQQRHGDPQRAAELFKKIGSMKAEEISREENRAMKLKTGARPQ